MKEPVFKPGGLLGLALVVVTIGVCVYLADFEHALEARWGHWVLPAYIALCGLAMWVQMTPEEKANEKRQISE